MESRVMLFFLLLNTIFYFIYIEQLPDSIGKNCYLIVSIAFAVQFWKNSSTFFLL